MIPTVYYLTNSTLDPGPRAHPLIFSVPGHHLGYKHKVFAMHPDNESLFRDTAQENHYLARRIKA